MLWCTAGCWDPWFLQSIVWGSTMSSNITNSVTTCMLTIPSCMLNFRLISQRMLQLPLTAYRDVKSWMVSHNLLLNECKTEAVVISAAQNRKRVQPPVDLVIDVCGCSVTPKPFIRDIGFVFDDTMSMAAQIRRVCQVAYCHIRGIATIRKCLFTIACKIIIHALACPAWTTAMLCFMDCPRRSCGNCR